MYHVRGISYPVTSGIKVRTLFLKKINLKISSNHFWDNCVKVNKTSVSCKQEIA
jgi:hypothetical protein